LQVRRGQATSVQVLNQSPARTRPPKPWRRLEGLGQILRRRVSAAALPSPCGLGFGPTNSRDSGLIRLRPGVHAVQFLRRVAAVQPIGDLASGGSQRSSRDAHRADAPKTTGFNNRTFMR
jgi:hypothetical protein